MQINSILFKILSAVIIAFFAAAVCIMIVSHYQVLRTIDHEKTATYTERLDTILGMLERKNTRLEATGLVEVYREDFEKTALNDIRRQYYRKEYPTFPTIIDYSGNVILSHNEENGQQAGVIGLHDWDSLLSERRGAFTDLHVTGKRHWHIYATFDDWGWIIVYSLPLHQKYAAAYVLRNSLILIMGVTITLVFLVLSIVISRMVKPIKYLTGAARAFAKGDLEYPVLIESKDEVGVLSESFSQMRRALREKITELEDKNKILLETSSELEKLKGNLEEEVEKKAKELIQANDRLIRAERLAAIGQLGGTVAHEFRNQLGVIRNATYFLNMKLKTDDEKIKRHLQILDEQVETTNRIIENILSFSRSKKPTLEKVHVKAFLEGVVEKSLREAPQGITIELKCNDGVAEYLSIDPVQMMQVCTNLIRNAVDAMYNEGKVLLQVKQKDNTLMWQFIDTGSGIPPENMEKIFEPLFTTKSRGAGFGLPMVKIIMERHGGNVAVESAIGQGTCFTLSFPISD